MKKSLMNIAGCACALVRSEMSVRQKCISVTLLTLFELLVRYTCRRDFIIATDLHETCRQLRDRTVFLAASRDTSTWHYDQILVLRGTCVEHLRKQLTN